MAKGAGKRYYVLSFSVSSDELLWIKAARNRRKLSTFLRTTVLSSLPAPLPAAGAASDHASGGGNV